MRTKPLFLNLVLAFFLLSLSVRAAMQTEMVPMRDGAKLATDIYLPDGDGPFPTVLVRSYYARGAGVAFGAQFNKESMAFVIQDNRGRGGSEGKDMVFTDDGWGELQDGRDTVEWLRAQKWSNGKVGTFGMSALGITQLRLAGTGVPLDGQVIWVGSGNFYGELSYIGGVFRKSMLESWTASNKSSHILSVWKEHPSFDEYWKGFDSNARANLAKAPALHVGGWWDIFNQGTIDAFVARQHKGGDGARGKQRLVMGAWTHGGPMGEKAGELVMPKSWAFDLGGQSLQFLKHCLMGGPSEIADGPAVRYYTLGDVSDQAAPGNEWRTADDWPPFKTQEMAFYLAPDGLLAKDSAADAKPLTYTFDPANPCPTKGGSNLVLPAGPFDQREIAQRPDVLSFATEPLTEPIEITGRVKVRLFVSSDAPDTDFTAKLLDIYPDGRAMGMLDGIQRVKYRKGFEKPDPLAPGTVVELEIDLWSISLIVNKGHRIGLQVSSSNYPRFELNPNTGADFPTEGGEMRKAANTVYLDKERPSALLLPVRPETQ